jgi:hypothetical protein
MGIADSCMLSHSNKTLSHANSGIFRASTPAAVKDFRRPVLCVKMRACESYKKVRNILIVFVMQVLHGRF